jgi:hypothetical protein
VTGSTIICIDDACASVSEQASACIHSISFSFCYIIVYSKMSDYYNFILDDSDGDGDGDGDGDRHGDGGIGWEVPDQDLDLDLELDTQWITEYENQILLSDYASFLKTDITRVSFQFIYLDREKKSIELVVPMTELYQLQHANQISQSELLRIIHKFQNYRMKNNKKYYNFQSLLLYDFQMPENGDNDIRWVSEYLSPPLSRDDDNYNEYGRVIEYTNLLSFDTIYFRPLIAMFHDLIGFTVVLYED